MSAYPFDASGEEDAGEVVPGESPIGGRSRNRLELHLHRGILDIDLCLNGSRPYPSRAGEPVASDGEYWGHRFAGHGHQRRPHSKSRPDVSRRTRDVGGYVHIPARVRSFSQLLGGPPPGRAGAVQVAGGVAHIRRWRSPDA